MTHCFDVNTLF